MPGMKAGAIAVKGIALSFFARHSVASHCTGCQATFSEHGPN
jgi:hypothetical protein